MDTEKFTIEQFGAKIKQKYPAYSKLSDAEIGQKMLVKYPQYKDKIITPSNLDTGLTPGLNTVSSATGVKKLGEGIGQTLSNILGGQKKNIDAQNTGLDIQTNLLKQINADKAQGKDTTKLESALRDLTDHIATSGKEITDLGTGGLSNREVVGSAVQTATNIAGVGLNPASSAIGRIAQGTGIGIATGASQSAIQNESGTDIAKGGLAGGILGGAFSGAIEGVKWAVKGVPKLLSYTSNTPEEVLQRNFDNPEAMVKAQKYIADASPSKVLEDVQGSVRGLRKDLTQQWQEGTDTLITKYADNPKSFFGWNEGSKEYKLFNKIADEYAIDLPQNLSNISLKEGIAFNTELNSLLSKPAIKMSPEGVAIRKAKDILSSKIDGLDTILGEGGNKAGIKQFLSNYGTEKETLDAANQLVQAYKTKNPVAQTTALSRLRNAFNENKPAYLSALKDLEEKTGIPILDKIATLQTQQVLPKAGISASNKLIDLLILPASSPRSSAALSRQAGRIAQSKTPQGVRNVAITGVTKLFNR